MNRKIIIVVSCLILMSGCALSRDVVYLDDRIDVIEKKISNQKVSVEDSSKNIKGEYAKLNNRFDNLAEQIRRIDGRFEENTYIQEKNKSSSDKLTTEIERLDLLLADLSRRMAHLETYVGFNSDAPRMSAPVNTAPITAPVTNTSPEAQLYIDAQAALEKDDMKTAREGFGRLIKNYPNSPNADNAQFWIGESFYREKWYQKAILEYQKVIENYPKGNKVASAYLKQGLAFFELGEADNAKLILNELIKKFQGSSEAAIAKKKLDSSK
ncbi:MAG: tol-pal system protein YbgF [Proteobacteria bacterium]|nr:tol-pal system protein YbgF [Pseudomonadota bacterium]